MMRAPTQLGDGWGEIEVGRGRISYLARGVNGTTEPLVLLPALGGGAARWGIFAEHIAAKRPWLAFDPRGFGRSSPPERGLSTRGMAQDLLVALDALELPSVDLFGESLGALVGTWLGISSPRRVKHLVLASCAARGLELAPRSLPRALALARDLLFERRPKRALARDLATRPGTLGAARAEAHAAEEPWSRAKTLRFLSAVVQHDARAELGGLRMPTLLLHGRRDVILGTEAQRDLLQRLPNAELRELDDAGHALTSEAPERCASLVLEFLARA